MLQAAFTKRVVMIALVRIPLREYVIVVRASVLVRKRRYKDIEMEDEINIGDKEEDIQQEVNRPTKKTMELSRHATIKTSDDLSTTSLKSQDDDNKDIQATNMKENLIGEEAQPDGNHVVLSTTESSSDDIESPTFLFLKDILELEWWKESIRSHGMEMIKQLLCKIQELKIPRQLPPPKPLNPSSRSILENSDDENNDEEIVTMEDLYSLWLGEIADYVMKKIKESPFIEYERLCYAWSILINVWPHELINQKSSNLSIKKNDNSVKDDEKMTSSRQLMKNEEKEEKHILIEENENSIDELAVLSLRRDLCHLTLLIIGKIVETSTIGETIGPQLETRLAMLAITTKASLLGSLKICGMYDAKTYNEEDQENDQQSLQIRVMNWGYNMLRTLIDRLDDLSLIQNTLKEILQSMLMTSNTTTINTT